MLLLWYEYYFYTQTCRRNIGNNLMIQKRLMMFLLTSFPVAGQELNRPIVPWSLLSSVLYMVLIALTLELLQGKRDWSLVWVLSLLRSSHDHFQLSTGRQSLIITMFPLNGEVLSKDDLLSLEAEQSDKPIKKVIRKLWILDDLTNWQVTHKSVWSFPHYPLIVLFTLII